MVPRNGHIRSYGYIGVQVVCRNARSLQAHLLLHRGHSINGGLGFGSLQGLNHDDKSGTVIESLAGDSVALQRGKGPVYGYGRAGQDAKILHLLLADAADVDEHIFGLDHLLSVLILHDMGGLAADDAGDGSGSGMDDDPLVEEGLVKPAADANKTKESLLVHMFYHEADLVGMGLDHDGGCHSLLGGDEISQFVQTDLIHVRRNLLSYYLLDGSFPARYAVCIAQFFQ